MCVSVTTSVNDTARKTCTSEVVADQPLHQVRARVMVEMQDRHNDDIQLPAITLPDVSTVRELHVLLASGFLYSATTSHLVQ